MIFAFFNIYDKLFDIKIKLKITLKPPQWNSRFGLACVRMTLFDLKVNRVRPLVWFAQFEFRLSFYSHSKFKRADFKFQC